jgi:hypothetical protein
VSGEAMAMLVHQQLYDGKPVSELTQAEKENIRAVATLASGLVGGVAGDGFENAATAASAGYNAAVNNELAQRTGFERPVVLAKTPLEKALYEVEGNLGGRESRSEDEDRAWDLILKTVRERCPAGVCSTPEDRELLRISKMKPRFSYQGLASSHPELLLPIGRLAEGVGFLGKTGARFIGGLFKGGAATVRYEAIGSTGKIGEEALKALGGRSQVYFQTSSGGRYVDQLVNGVANEAKVGYTTLTKSIQTQIAKDAELLAKRDIEAVVWNFFKSPVTGKGGPSAPLIDALNKAGFNYIIH